MAEATEAEEQMSLRHKKERRDLQAQIQVLKKSICKGDKKRKKEVSEEINRLESEMDVRHDAEVVELKTGLGALAKLSCEDAPENEAGESVEASENGRSDNAVKVSKARKRRDKKASAEKERNERIIEQEALNVFGKRNVETQAIRKILIERDLAIHEIPSDGHCLYNAVAHQLKVHGEIPLSLKDLRTKASSYLRENMNEFLPFLSNPDSEEMLSSEQFEKYCDNVANTSAWGGAIELQVLSHVLQCPIEVVQATGAPYLVGTEYSSSKRLILTYHRHMYELGAHYNSVTKFVKDEES